MKKLKIAGYLLFFCLLSFSGFCVHAYLELPPACVLDEKTVHVSIDDCADCLKNLCSPDIRSVFDVPFFRQLKEWHERFDARFTCYIYAKSGKFSITEIPDSFRKEFEEQSDWLKFGYHSTYRDIRKTKAQSGKEFAVAFARANKEIDRFAGKSARSEILRLDYFFAKESWMPSIYRGKTRYLLGPDSEGRKAYTLSAVDSSRLWEKGFFPFNGVCVCGGGGGYLRTDARYEKMGVLAWWDLENMRDQVRIVIFTHEWAMSPGVISRMESSFRWFVDNRYKFVCSY